MPLVATSTSHHSEASEYQPVSPSVSSSVSDQYQLQTSPRPVLPATLVIQPSQQRLCVLFADGSHRPSTNGFRGFSSSSSSVALRRALRFVSSSSPSRPPAAALPAIHNGHERCRRRDGGGRVQEAATLVCRFARGDPARDRLTRMAPLLEFSLPFTHYILSKTTPIVLLFLLFLLPLLSLLSLLSLLVKRNPSIYFMLTCLSRYLVLPKRSNMPCSRLSPLP